MVPVAATASALTIDDLTPVEQAVMKLGANPDAIQPISWLNSKHLDSLKASNSLSADLERRISAFQLLKAQEGA